ncbi:PhoD-like phosphatase-domain-containing protein [Irpex rosettiformis]|uniref:PhoD-like phosphatase-domain-containing protein n=1 Tax=Irpex rosettiformis TaxID=378272 RepID=A0ACB8TXB7_9APHY|nr:PhoD-like phosphatase-domain-containing protein [Irpex rosettiformis]
MAVLAYASAVISTLFRLLAYIFLRVIPARLGPKALPALYVLHLSSLALLPADESAPPRPATHKNGNGISSKDEINETKPLPAIPAQRSHIDTVKTLLLSIPSPIKALTAANILINTILLLLVVDLVLEPYLDDAKDVIFTRVGAVYPDSARIVIRYPHENSTDGALVIVLWRQITLYGDPVWTSGPTVNLTQENDWVSTAVLDSLWPSTDYEYALGDAEGNKLPYPPNPIHFHTFPDPRLSTGSHFRFLATSCVTTNFPYKPFNGRRIKGFDLLADYLWPSRTVTQAGVNSVSDALNETDSSANSRSALDKFLPDNLAPPAEFLMFLGDFIYADVPFYFGDNAEHYRRLYRRNYQSESFRKVYENLPIFHAYDDHEIINNYMGAGNDSKLPFASADDAFKLYNANSNYNPAEPGQHYYHFRFSDTAFFVLDTRRYRSDVTEQDDAASRTMLGDKQLAALYEWLGKVNNTATFKFIVSSVPFTSLWQHDAQVDSWAAYPSEKLSLLNALHSVPNVIIISGDRHEFAAIKFNGEGQGHTILEVSTSPLSMFYIPFFRTLKSTSDGTVNTIKEAKTVVGGEEVTSLVEDELPQEEVVKYIAEGNYKWSSFEVDTRDPEHPVVKLEVVIDGFPAYSLEIIGRPVELKVSSALGSVVPNGFLNILDKIGLNPISWF